jgi:putative ABC transport system permease protein
MRHLRAWLHRCAGLLRRDARERDLRAELESHFQLHIDDNLRAGMTPEEARRAAVLKFGPVEAIKEQYRDRSGLPALSVLLRDARFALRMLRRQPGFAAAVVATLALGIGVNTAVFSVVDAVLLRPLPYAAPDRIVQIKGPGMQSFVRFDEARSWITPDIAGSPAFASMSHYLSGAVNVGGEPAERLRAAEVSPEFFDVMGIGARLGRTFTADDVQGQVAVIGDRLWRERFDADRGILGSRIALDGMPFEIVGVMPSGVDFPDSSRLWVPTRAPTQIGGWVYTYFIMARLADGATRAGALDDIIVRSRLPAPRAAQLELVQLRNMLAGAVRPIAMLVWVAAGLVLLIACINTANLLLARVASREREFAVRRAIGASGAHLVRQVASESAVLACLAALAALPAAFWTIEAARGLLPPTLHGVERIGLDLRTLGFIGALTLLTAMAFGLGPALSIPGRAAADVLRGIAATRVDRFWSRFRSVLVVGEVAVALLLLTGAVTLVTTLRTIMATETGVREERVVAFELSLPASSYPADRKRQFLQELESTLRGLPGVDAVGMTVELPGRPAPLRAEQVMLHGETPAKVGRSIGITASPGYFDAAGIELLAGRAFTDADTRSGASVVIVSESYARAVGVQPALLVGRQAVVSPRTDRPPSAEIIGVVRDVRMRGPEGEFFTAVYLPLHTAPSAHAPTQVIVRAARDPMALIPSIRAVVARLDASVPLYNVQAFGDVLAGRLADRRFAMRMLVLFAALGIVLSILGLYSVVSYLVHTRTREIGIRMAVGATPADVLRHVLSNGLAHATAGVLLGAAGVAAASRLVTSRVPGIGDVDVSIVVLLAVLLVAVAAVATCIPARRATRIDPALTLRAE